MTEHEHKYGEDDRCICGAIIVYFEDAKPHPGAGCEKEGKPWNWEVRRLDPQERRDDERFGELKRYQFMTPKGMMGSRFTARSEAQAEARAIVMGEDVLDLMDSIDEYGKPIILLVVADE
jgi:hypothetical protein